MKTYSYTFEEIVNMLPVRDEEAHKGSCGKLLLIAGSKNMAGAAFLSAKAAYRSGAGLVYIYTTEANRVILQQLIPEAVLCTYEEGKADPDQVRELMKGKDAVAIGPGIGLSQEMLDTVSVVLQGDLPVCLDADGLNNVAKETVLLKRKRCPLVITPHLLEMTRVSHITMNELIAEKEKIASDFAKENALITVLKGHNTLVTDGKEMYVNHTGNHGMATGGSGDVLTGVIGSFLAQKMDPFAAAIAGVYLHGKAGDDAAVFYGKRSLMAGDIAEYVCRGL